MHFGKLSRFKREKRVRKEKDLSWSDIWEWLSWWLENENCWDDLEKARLKAFRKFGFNNLKKIKYKVFNNFCEKWKFS